MTYAQVIVCYRGVVILETALTYRSAECKANGGTDKLGLADCGNETCMLGEWQANPATGQNAAKCQSLHEVARASCRSGIGKMGPVNI